MLWKEEYVVVWVVYVCAIILRLTRLNYIVTPLQPLISTALSFAKCTINETIKPATYVTFPLCHSWFCFIVVIFVCWVQACLHTAHSQWKGGLCLNCANIISSPQSLLLSLSKNKLNLSLSISALQRLHLERVYQVLTPPPRRLVSLIKAETNRSDGAGSTRCGLHKRWAVVGELTSVFSRGWAGSIIPLSLGVIWSHKLKSVRFLYGLWKTPVDIL